MDLDRERLFKNQRHAIFLQLNVAPENYPHSFFLRQIDEGVHGFHG